MDLSYGIKFHRKEKFYETVKERLKIGEAKKKDASSEKMIKKNIFFC